MGAIKHLPAQSANLREIEISWVVFPALVYLFALFCGYINLLVIDSLHSHLSNDANTRALHGWVSSNLFQSIFNKVAPLLPHKLA